MFAKAVRATQKTWTVVRSSVANFYYPPVNCRASTRPCAIAPAASQMYRMKKTPDKMMIESPGSKTQKPSALGGRRLHVFMFMGRCPHVHFVVLMLVGRRSFSYWSASILCDCH